MIPDNPHTRSSAPPGWLTEADAALARRDLESARRILSEATLPSDDATGAGLWWSRRAKLEFESRHFNEAAQAGRRAIDLMQGTLEHEGLAHAQLTLGYTLTATGGIREAELVLRDAISNLRRGGRESELSEPYNALAQVYFLRSDFDRACEYLQEARHIALQHGRANDALRVLGNLGRVLLLAGRWEEAEVALREALAAQEQQGRAIGIVRNLLSLGYLYLLQHREEAVRPLFRRAAEIIDEHDFVLERVILLEYEGDLALSLDRFDEAREKLEAALALGDRLATQSSIQNQVERRLADVACAQGQFERALEHAQKAIDVSATLGDRQEEGSALRALGTAQAGLGREYRGAFDRSLSVLRSVGDPYELSRAYLAYGTALAHTGDAKLQTDALRMLERSREMASDLGSEKVEAEVAMAQAQARAGMGQLDAALAYLASAEAVLGERALTYRRQLETRLVSEAVSPQNEFLVFKSFVPDGEAKSASLDTDLGNLARKLDADSACLLVRNQGRVTCPARFGPAQFDAPALGEAFEPLWNGGSDGRPLLYTDLAAHPEFARRLAGAGRNAVSVIAVPLSFAGETIGLIYLERSIPDRPFGRSALNLAVAFAEPLAFRVAEQRARARQVEGAAGWSEAMKESAFPTIITRNREMLAMMAQVAQVKDAPITIALEGETGVGKDLLAKAIHTSSVRKQKRFVSVNCAALPESLLESELFGHMKGAYTGADRDKPGLLEEADGGTFFLDEIGEMPLAIQAKLLRVLEEKEVIRLGDTKPRKVDIRIIIASNRDLKAEMEQGQFRQDLFYRLCTLSFRVPALRERREDIPLLIDYFLGKYSPPHENEGLVRIDPVAFQWLVEYDWPGNVRELENEIKKLVLLSGARRTISPDLLSRKFFRPDSTGTSGERPMGEDRGFSLYDFLALYEKKYIQQALVEHHWVKKHAARSLSIPESTLRLKMKQYGLRQEPETPS
jgi:transcriptional regulator with GAF, ATPase, and Fis domain/tetratricopeptide (TPR) repeat protein